MFTKKKFNLLKNSSSTEFSLKDLKFNTFLRDITKKENKIHHDSDIVTESNKVINSEIVNPLIHSINELKTLNECINNGEINTFFS